MAALATFAPEATMAAQHAQAKAAEALISTPGHHEQFILIQICITARVTIVLIFAIGIVFATSFLHVVPFAML